MGDTGRTAMGNLGRYTSGPDRTMADIVRDVIADVQSIMRSEVRLVRTEVKEEAAKAIGASQLFLAGAAMGIAAAAFLLVTIFEALCLVLAPWLAALALFVVLAAIAGGMIAAGRTRWKTFHATPEKTVETVKENMEWARNQTKS